MNKSLLADKLLSPIQSTMSANLVIMALGMVSGILTARILGPAGRGEIAAAVVWPATIATLGTLGVPDAMVYQAGREKGIGAVVAAGLCVGVAQLLLMGFLGAVIIPRALDSQGPHVIRMSVTYMTILIYAFIGNYAVAIILGTTRFSVWNGLRLLNPILYLGAMLLLWSFGRVTSENVLRAMLIGPVVTTIAASFVVAKITTGPLIFDPRTIKSVISYGFDSALSSWPLFLKDNVAQIVMSTVLSSSQLGIYAVSLVAASPISPLFNAFQTIIFPKTAAEPDSALAKRALTEDIAKGFWISTLLLVVLVFTLPPFIRMCYGSAYVPSIIPAQLLTLSMFLNGLGQMIIAGFRGLGMPRAALWGNLLGLAVVGLLLPTFLSRWGLVGAAAASLISSAITVLAFVYLIRSRAGISLREMMKPEFGRWLQAGRISPAGLH